MAHSVIREQLCVRTVGGRAFAPSFRTRQGLFDSTHVVPSIKASKTVVQRFAGKFQGAVIVVFVGLGHQSRDLECLGLQAIIIGGVKSLTVTVIHLLRRSPRPVGHARDACAYTTNSCARDGRSSRDPVTRKFEGYVGEMCVAS